MPNVGPTELLIVVALLAVLLAIVAAVVMAVRKSGRAVSGEVPAAPLTPQGLHETVTGLTHSGQKIRAIKELRQYTGLGLKEAKTVVDAVAMGHDLRSHPLMAGFRSAHSVGPASTTAVTGPDLATRVRELKAAGRVEQAIHLVRGETGMDEREAGLFVETL